jgi:hypothetical protein
MAEEEKRVAEEMQRRKKEKERMEKEQQYCLPIWTLVWHFCQGCAASLDPALRAEFDLLVGIFVEAAQRRATLLFRLRVILELPAHTFQSIKSMKIACHIQPALCRGTLERHSGKRSRVKSHGTAGRSRVPRHSGKRLGYSSPRRDVQRGARLRLKLGQLISPSNFFRRALSFLSFLALEATPGYCTE